MSAVDRTDALKLIDQSLTKTIGGQVQFDGDTDLIDAGYLDSLDFVLFIFNLEKCFGTKLPIVDLAESGLTRVGNLVDFMVERAGS